MAFLRFFLSVLSLHEVLTMEKFLVTGGAGFIGSNICKKLISEGCFVRVIDNLLTGEKSNLADIIDKIEFIEADMGDEDAARSAMKDIDVVLHLGALPSVPRSVDDPAAVLLALQRMPVPALAAEGIAQAFHPASHRVGRDTTAADR